MKPTTRRDFLRASIANVAALGLPSLALGSASLAKGGGANSEIRLGMIGLGGIGVVGGVGGRGRQLIAALRDVPGIRIVALCDLDRTVLEDGVQRFKEGGKNVAAYGDIRKLLDDKSIDAVVIAIPNHWHALATVWACQAGKDVYVEKPFSYNIWEGRQAVAAAQAPTHGAGGHAEPFQPRASPGIRILAERPTRSDSLGARHRVPAAGRHWQDERAHARSCHGRLRRLVRSSSEGAVDAQAVALRLALVLGHRQRRDRQQRHPRD